jgi:hypothetical protein
MTFGGLAGNPDLEAGGTRGRAAADRFCGLSGDPEAVRAGACRWRMGLVAGELVWAGQATAAGGPQAASNRFSHCAWWCQPSGRCKVIWPRPWRAVRAATSIRSRRSVAPRALAWARLARAPTARSRLQLIAAQASQAALAGKEPPAGARGAVVPVGEDLLDDGVVAVVFLGLDHLERAVGEHGVITPGGEQFLLPAAGGAGHVADAADDQPGSKGNRCPASVRVRGERGVFRLGDLGVRDPAA